MSSFAAAQSWYWGSTAHPWFFLGFLFWLLPLIVFGLLVFLLVKWLFRADCRGGSGPLRIVEERYARGEITKEQFEQMKRDLR